ncbi:MAG TPA: SPOR domain-containing protein, partial [Methylocella sp.]|nr:SPOR domain-containing protein [Methylocella sp.]
GGHLMLFVTRAKEPFWRPPLPAAKLFWAIAATQAVAALLSGLGLLVPQLAWTVIGLVWAYNLAWLLVQDAVKIAIYGELDQRAREAAPWIARMKKPLLPDHAMAAAAGQRVRPAAAPRAGRPGASPAHIVTMILGLGAAASLLGALWAYAPQAGAARSLAPETPSAAAASGMPPAAEPAPAAEENSESKHETVPEPATPPQPEKADTPGAIVARLGAASSEAMAMAMWRRLQKQLPGPLAGRAPILQKVEENRRAPWRIAAGGFAGAEEAENFCKELRAKGAACRVITRK